MLSIVLPLFFASSSATRLRSLLSPSNSGQRLFVALPRSVLAALADLDSYASSTQLAARAAVFGSLQQRQVEGAARSSEHDATEDDSHGASSAIALLDTSIV